MDLNSLLFTQLERQQIPLVNQFYKRVYKKGIAKKNEQVFVLKGQRILCTARLKDLKGELLLTGVACLDEVRGQGIASLLVKKLLSLQAQTIYCFPYPHLQHFYQKLGFTLCPLEKLPEDIAIRFQRYNERKPLLCMVKYIE